MAKLSEQIKKANVSNILKKVKSNKVVSKQELEAIEEYEQQQEEKQSLVNSDNRIILTSAQTARFFDVTTMTINNWLQLGFPKESKNTYDLKKCFTWWQENINQGSSKKEDDARERYWYAKAEGEEIKILRIKGELIKSEDVAHEFAQRAGDLKTTLRALKYRLSGLLAGKTQEEIMQILEQEIDEMLRNFCREGKYITSDKKNARVGVSVKKTAKNKTAGTRKKETSKTKATKNTKTTAKSKTVSKRGAKK